MQFHEDYTIHDIKSIEIYVHHRIYTTRVPSNILTKYLVANKISKYDTFRSFSISGHLSKRDDEPYEFTIRYCAVESSHKNMISKMLNEWFYSQSRKTSEDTSMDLIVMPIVTLDPAWTFQLSNVYPACHLKETTDGYEIPLKSPTLEISNQIPDKWLEQAHSSMMRVKPINDPLESYSTLL